MTFFGLQIIVSDKMGYITNFYIWRTMGEITLEFITLTNKSLTIVLYHSTQFPKSLTDFLTWPKGIQFASKTNTISRASRGWSSEKSPGAKTEKEDYPTSGDVQGSTGQRANVGSISNRWS